MLGKKRQGIGSEKVDVPKFGQILAGTQDKESAESYEGSSDNSEF